MTTLNLPIVKGEDAFSKNGRMIFIIGIIVVGMLMIINIQSTHQNDLYIPQYVKKNPVRMECMQSDHMKTELSNAPVMAKTIVLYNLNKMTIPVNQIIIIGTDNVISYITRNNAIVTHTNRGGSSVQFNLPKETRIKEVIVDVDMVSKSRANITTTQVDVRDKDDTVVWTNCEPLYNGKRYISLRIVKPLIIYPTMSQKLCTGLSGEQPCTQENTLNNTLQENTWN